MLPPYKTTRIRVNFRFLYIFSLIISLTGYAHAAEQRYTEKDFTHWLNAAYIAQATYGTDEELIDQLNKQGYKVTRLQQIPGLEVSYILATDDAAKHHILAVRGTANVRNVIVNSAFVLVPDKLTGIDIHQGFLLSSRDIYQQIEPLIKPGYSIDTIGHSLGGAAALILAMMLDVHGHTVGEVITFGQPKVTNISGSRKFKHLNITRLVTEKDIVPLVPPIDLMDLMNMGIFWHQGIEIVLYPNNRYSVLSGMSSMRRAADFLNDVPGQQHLKNHFMTTYIQYIKTKLESPVEITYESDFKFSDWFGSPAGTEKK